MVGTHHDVVRGQLIWSFPSGYLIIDDFRISYIRLALDGTLRWLLSIVPCAVTHVWVRRKTGTRDMRHYLFTFQVYVADYL
jgi:hypothetical protein